MANSYFTISYSWSGEEFKFAITEKEGPNGGLDKFLSTDGTVIYHIKMDGNRVVCRRYINQIIKTNFKGKLSKYI